MLIVLSQHVVDRLAKHLDLLLLFIIGSLDSEGLVDIAIAVLAPVL